ncbi:glycosyl hydrolase family 71-domain-containing protein, partial [Xylariales sp. PMI_506]
DWQTDIGLAVDAHLDAFALNIAYGDGTVSSSLELAFEAAVSASFHLFFSFDYAGGTGPWPSEDVLAYATQYFGNANYYTYNGQPFVSSFEGPDNADDWVAIKASTGCFFVPDWSSEGADAALQLGGGNVVDGLFNWGAWPWGPNDINTYTNASYYQYMGKNISGPDPGVGLAYMMPVSPWFFTNLPGYDKNWMWRGDDLWFDRWVEVIYNLPEFVEIISWNDYGESHYIGPLYDYAMEAFTIGEAPYNYAENMPHDGWRKFLPYVVDMYKTGTATISQEGLVAWYRTSPGQSCDTGGTTGNTASQLQIEYEPYEIAQDYVFFSALLGSDADVSVSIGGISQTGTWSNIPDGGIGIYHGSVPFNGAGAVVITLSRDGATIAEVSDGPDISDSCTDGITNWNAWVGEADGDAISATPTLTRSEQACIQGTGMNNFAGICSFSCGYGYCPISACVCEAVGEPVTAPSATGPVGYPISGEDASYEGVCAFDCEHGYCPDSACTTVSAPLTTPTVSDFYYPACIAGEVLSSVSAGLTGLCSFACNYGFCPIHACECTSEGALADSSYLEVDTTCTPVDGLDDYGLCDFACSDSGGDGVVDVTSTIWSDPAATIGCVPPCTLVLPPSPLATPLVVNWPPYST